MRKILKKSILLIIIVLALITLTGCSFNFGGLNGQTANEQAKDIEGLPVYTADEDMTGYTKCEEMEGIEFYYPSNYMSVGKAEQPMYMDTEILGASVNLVSSEFPSAFSFEGYVDASVLGIKEEMEINGDVETEYINLNGVRAAKLEYTTNVEEESMKVVQVLVLKDEKAYILTIGGYEDDFAELQPKMDKMIKSFR